MSPWARLCDHIMPTSNSQENHFLPHPLQGPDEGGREGHRMDITLRAVRNGFQMCEGMWNKPRDLGQTQANCPAIPHFTSRCRYWSHGRVQATCLAQGQDLNLGLK